MQLHVKFAELLRVVVRLLVQSNQVQLMDVILIGNAYGIIILQRSWFLQELT